MASALSLCTGCTLCAAIQPVRFGLLLLLAKAYPLGAARVASQQETAIEGEEGWLYIPMSRIAYFRLFFGLLAACLLVDVSSGCFVCESN